MLLSLKKIICYFRTHDDFHREYNMEGYRETVHTNCAHIFDIRTPIPGLRLASPGLRLNSPGLSLTSL